MIRRLFVLMAAALLAISCNGNDWYAGIDVKPGSEEQDNDPSLPSMGKSTAFTLTGVGELSGLCMGADSTFLWGVGDEGTMYRIGFDGSATEHFSQDLDMEGITMDPVKKDLYLCIEGEQKIVKVPAPGYNSASSLWYVKDAVDGKYGNDGIEGIAWYKDNSLYVGSQTDANLWRFKADGTKQSLVSLKDFTSSIIEVADLCYDPVGDRLWVVDSKEYKLFLFKGDASALLKIYDLSKVTRDNPESVCVDRRNKCIWIADDSKTSVLYKIAFTNL